MHSIEEWPAEYLEFIRLFNEGDYFEAHEVLEDLWVIEVGPLKDFYKGWIQLSVALLHWQRGNHSGARKLWASARQYLSHYPSVCEGLHLDSLRNEFECLFHPLACRENPPGKPPQREAIPFLEACHGEPATLP